MTANTFPSFFNIFLFNGVCSFSARIRRAAPMLAHSWDLVGYELAVNCKVEYLLS